MQTLYELLLEAWLTFFPAGMKWWFSYASETIIYIITAAFILPIFLSPFIFLFAFKAKRRKLK